MRPTRFDPPRQRRAVTRFRLGLIPFLIVGALVLGAATAGAFALVKNGDGQQNTATAADRRSGKELAARSERSADRSEDRSEEQQETQPGSVEAPADADEPKDSGGAEPGQQDVRVEPRGQVSERAATKVVKPARHVKQAKATKRARAEAARQKAAKARTKLLEAQEKAVAEQRAGKLALVARAERERAAEKRAAEKRAEKKAVKNKANKRPKYALPTKNYTLTATFGQAGSSWSSGYHTGLDFAAPTGTPVRAVRKGEIIESGYAGAYGNRLALQTKNGNVFYYCHLDSFKRSSGKVRTGQVIGYVGSTGNSTGPHLHFEYRPGGGDPADPYTWLENKGLNP